MVCVGDVSSHFWIPADHLKRKADNLLIKLSVLLVGVLNIQVLENRRRAFQIGTPAATRPMLRRLRFGPCSSRTVPQAVTSAVAEMLTLLAGFGKGKEKKGFFDWYFNSRKPKDPQPMARTTPMRIEPKTFFANERTFLSWLHMAVTIGSIAAALLGFAGVTESHKKPDIRVSSAAKHTSDAC